MRRPQLCPGFVLASTNPHSTPQFDARHAFIASKSPPPFGKLVLQVVTQPCVPQPSAQSARERQSWLFEHRETNEQQRLSMQASQAGTEDISTPHPPASLEPPAPEPDPDRNLPP